MGPHEGMYRGAIAYEKNDPQLTRTKPSSQHNERKQPLVIANTKTSSGDGVQLLLQTTQPQPPTKTRTYTQLFQERMVTRRVQSREDRV